MDIFEMGAELASKCQSGELTKGDLMQSASDLLIKSLRTENAEERARLMNLALAYKYACELTK